MADPPEQRIHWPPKFDPSRAPVHVRNELVSQGQPELVFAWLVRAVRWPEWYDNSSDVRLPESARDLELGMQFSWRTFGVSLVSVVEELVPGQRIAWRARCFGLLAYHAWLITPTSGGCSILTEETQYGALARLGQLLMPKRMHAGHDRWLNGLDRVAKTGAP